MALKFSQPLPTNTCSVDPRRISMSRTYWKNPQTAAMVFFVVAAFGVRAAAIGSV